MRLINYFLFLMFSTRFSIRNRLKDIGVSFIADKASSLIWVLIVVAIALGALGILE